MRRSLLIAALAAAIAMPPLAAKTLRWTSQRDVLTLDPMARNESLNNTFSDYVYEGLVRYNRLFAPEPALALSWTRPEPTRWRFNLRRNVRFHDGSPFTADDVVFSLERILKPSSNMKVYAQGVKELKKIDDFTVEIITDGPNPVLLHALVDKIKTEIDDSKRNGMMREVQVLHGADVGHIPLHQQVIPWAMRANVSAFHRADNRLDMRWVRVD